MPEKKFKTVLEIGGAVGSSLKNSFNVLTGNTKQLGATIKGLKSRAKELRGELENKKLGGPQAAAGAQKLQKELAYLEGQIKRTKFATDALARIKMADFGGRMQRIGSSLRAGALSITAGAAAIGAAMFALTKNSANYGDDAKKAAERMGIGINELIKLKHAAKLAGVEDKEFESSATNLFKSIEKARSGGDKGNILKLMKLDPKKLAGMDPAEALKTFSEAFKKLKGPYAKKKGLIAQVMTGDKKMANVLDLGRAGFAEAGDEAEKLNLTISENFAKNSEIFNDNLTKIGAALKGVGNVISEHLLPHFIKLSEWCISFVISKHGDIKKWAEDFGKYVEQNIPIWVEEAKKFGQQIGDLASKVWKVIEPLGGLKALLIGFVALQFAPVALGIGGLTIAFLTAIPAMWGVATALGAIMISALPIIGVVAGIGAALGLVGWAIMGVVENWDWYKEKFHQTITFSLDVLKKFGKFFCDVWEGVKKEFNAFVKSFDDSIDNMIRDLTTKISDWFNWFEDKFKWIGNSVKSVGGWFGGKKSVPGETISGARAFGGPVSAGKKYLVGERGPEIFQPRTSGQIIPNGNLRAGNQTVHNNITIHAAPGMDERRIADLVMARLNRQQLAFAGGALYD